jgi:hypothetical protein
MIVIAGPPGGGKSSVFPVSSFGVAFFNADDRAAELNRSSHVGIPTHIRFAVSREFEAFVLECIERRTSFAIETTLRSGVTFDQAERALLIFRRPSTAWMTSGRMTTPWSEGRRNWFCKAREASFGF